MSSQRKRFIPVKREEWLQSTTPCCVNLLADIQKRLYLFNMTELTILCREHALYLSETFN